MLPHSLRHHHYLAHLDLMYGFAIFFKHLPSSPRCSVPLSSVLEPVRHLEINKTQKSVSILHQVFLVNTPSTSKEANLMNLQKINSLLEQFRCNTCVRVRPVFFARVLFSSGVGYLIHHNISETSFHFRSNWNYFFLPVMFVHIFQRVAGLLLERKTWLWYFF